MLGRRLVPVLLGSFLFLYGCATGAPPTGQAGPGAEAEEAATIRADALDPAWRANVLRTRHYSFALPPRWTAETLNADEEGLLLSLIGEAGESGTLEFFSGPLGKSEGVTKRFLEASVVGEASELTEFSVEKSADSGFREFSSWSLQEGGDEVRYVLYGGLPGMVGGPSATWLLQGRAGIEEWGLAPWPATLISSLQYDYRLGDLRIREGVLTFYGGEQWQWLGDTPEGIVARRLEPGPEMVILLGSPHSRVASRLTGQGLSFEEPELELETVLREERVVVPLLVVQGDEGTYLHGRLEEGLHISVAPPGDSWEPESLLPEVGAFLEAHLFLEGGR